MATQAETEQLDQPVVFERLLSILDELYEKIGSHLTVFPTGQQPFQDFTSPDNTISGSLLTFTGEIIDKLIYTNVNAMPMGFGTMRLVIWLNSSIQVPHLAFEFGTTPDIFFYMDYIPRVDLWADLSYFERYYQAMDSTYLSLRQNSDLSVFVSKSLYVRQLQSPAHLCFTGSNPKASLDLVQNLSHEMCDRWLTWINQAEPVPEESRNTLAERDLQMRRIGAERDPGNAAIAKIFGEDFTHQLVRALWEKEPTVTDE
ncbi:MAG: hypothetical protein ACTS2F_08620 [Thainema sp.]